MTSRLITSEFTINDKPVQFIIDSGATASFIPAFGDCVKGKGMAITDIANRVQIADNETISLDKIKELETRISAKPDVTYKCQYYIIPKKDNLLGYQAIIGLNLMKHLIYQSSKRMGQWRPNLGAK